MTAWGTYTCTCHGPLGDPANFCFLFDSGQLGAALTGVSYDVTCNVTGYTGSAWDVFVYWFSQTGAALGSAQHGTMHFDTQTHVSGTFTPPAAATRFHIKIEAALNSPDTAVASGFGTYDTVSFCQYGGEVDTSKQIGYVITDAIIDAVVGGALAATGQLELLPYVETALAAIEGTIPFGVNCAVVPVGGTPLDLSNPSTLAPANLLAWFQQAAWSWFCECTAAPPGSPDPVAPIPPPVVTPPGVNLPAPVITCDGSDLCTYLNHLEQLVSQIGTQLGYLRTDVRLIQRQHVPFAYVPGTLHSGLTDAGQFGVSAILGLAVQLTTLPGRLGEEAGDPIAYFEAGWITTGNADGWRRSAPIRHNPLWVDVAPEDTLVGYSFTPGVVANIRELVREP